MSRKHTDSSHEVHSSRVTRFAQQILMLPRFSRILLAGVFALATTLAISPIVDELYLQHFYSEATVVLPSLIAAAIGLVMYIIGWQLVVGTVGEDTEAKTAIVWYFVVGIFAVLLVGLWLVRLIMLGTIALYMIL